MNQNQEKYNESLFSFIKNSPTQYHAVENMVKELLNNGFNQLREHDEWLIKGDSRYFVTRNGSSIIAFLTGANRPWNTGMRIIGAHTDSPCLKVKPIPEIETHGMLRIGIEVYGGALLNSWTDRGLNLAGRVTVLSLDDKYYEEDEENEINNHVQNDYGNEEENEYNYGKDVLQTLLINYDSPIATIPSLAIHLDRDANTKRILNPQIDLLPLLSTSKHTKTDNVLPSIEFRKILLERVVKEHSNINIKEVVDFDMSFSDAHHPFFTGFKREMISSPRLDNLLSCHAALRSIVRSANGNADIDFSIAGNFVDVVGCKRFEASKVNDSAPCFIVCTDHEEVGSDSLSGAKGSFFSSVISRLIPDVEQRIRSYAKSFIISLDNAHALHPAHTDRYDSNHTPLLNHGPVLKVNASQRYASDCESSSLFRTLCKCADVSIQTFVMRSDMPCGSTIGPLISSCTGIKTVDVGVSTLGMHAIREITGADDPFMMFQVLNQFFSMKYLPLLSLT